jgi:DNA replication protein DnaC
MISLTIELTPKTMLKCGILEKYHGVDFEDYYGYKTKWKEIEPLILAWNQKHINEPQKQIKLNYQEANEVLKLVANYAKHLINAKKKGISIMLAGSNGTGKTLLAVAIIKRAIRLGLTAQMTSLGGVLELYVGGWGDPRKKELFNQRIKDVDFLLIDDVGKEYQAKNSDLTEIMFDNLIRYRVFRNKPFILTTNTAPNDLKNRYGQSLMSLISGNCLKVKVVGEDFRHAIQSKNLWTELETDDEE